MRASVVLLIVSSVCPSSKYHPTNISTTSYSISNHRSLLDFQRWQKQWNNVRSSASMCYHHKGWHLIHVSGLHQVRLHMLPFYTESYFHYVLPIHTSHEILCLYISSLNRPIIYYHKPLTRKTGENIGGLCSAKYNTSLSTATSTLPVSAFSSNVWSSVIKY